MIKKIRIVGEIAVVTATPQFHPLRQLDQVSAELDKLNFEGSVLFDLLAVNGLADNRFVSIKFVNKELVRSTFALESNVAQSITDEQNCFANYDPAFLLGSVLSTSEIDELKH